MKVMPETSPTRIKRLTSESADPFLGQLGGRTRRLRARSGLTRRELAREAGVSERHLANLEGGVGNPSVQILRQVARALNCSVAELVGDEGDESADWLLIRDLLRGRSAEDLAGARRALTDHFGLTGSASGRNGRIALIGLRGAGKSTLGRMLAEDMRLPFIEINREIERLAGCSPEEIHALYGANAYRRYERQALEEVIARNPQAVVATPGGLVSEPTAFNLLLQNCFTIWLKAAPEEHMSRVVAQGDLRPMAGSRQAMEDLKMILAERAPFYAKADLTCDTTGKPLAKSFRQLKALLTDSERQVPAI
jgi:XRE family transcriptional regulator, aerobic/anaerobic benzoate catabolism transcriptional regulator